MKHVGNVTTKRAIFNSLVNNGPLVVSSDHVVPLMLPDVFEDGADPGTKIVDLTFMHSVFYVGAKMTDEVVRGGFHMATRLNRFAILLVDLDNAGMPTDPIAGPDVVAVPKLMARIRTWMTKLSLAQRTIDTGDVWYDDSGNGAGTDTWYDYITPNMLLRAGGGMELVAQFANLTPGCFLDDTGGRDDEAFTDILTQMENAVGRDISELPKAAQAAAIVAWLARTAPPPLYLVWVDTIDGYTHEIERRADKTEAGRFTPLFREGWRVHANLHALWPDDVDDVVNNTIALASSLEVAGASDGVTPAIVTAICTALATLLPFATHDNNAERTTDVISAYRTRNDAEGLTGQGHAQLQANADFAALRANIDAVAATDHQAIAKVMLAADHPAGILFLNTKFQPDKFWRERGGARTSSTLQAVFTKAVSFDTAGNAQEWGSVLPDGAALRFISGKFSMDLWKILQDAIAKREGASMVANINARVRNLPAKSFFSDPERLRITEWPLRECMKLIRLGGNESFAFPAYYRTLMRMANSIHNMPKTCVIKTALRNNLEDVAVRGMQCAQDRWEAMLATPATAAIRITEFTISGSNLAAINELDGRITRTLKEIEDGMHGLATDPSYNKRQRHEDWSEWSTQDTWSAQHEQASGAWGAAAHHGILATADCSMVAFGQNIVKFDGNKPDLAANCPACFAPGKGRDKWCTSPDACWAAAGVNAHARVDGFDEDACKPSTASAIAGFEWSAMTNVIVAATPGGGGGRGKGGRAKGGRGKGGGAKGGRGIAKSGKGSGKGKGGKGKGGKGKGGKGRQANFGRQ